MIITIFATMIEAIYDFLQYLVFGFDLPYLSKALTPLAIAGILGGAKLLTDVGQGISANRRAKKQRESGEQIAAQALERLEGLDYQAGPDFQAGSKFQVGQDTRDLVELQMRQSAEAIQNMRDQNLALSQQAIASGVQDPTRSGQTIANIAPSLSQQMGQSELAAAQQSTAAKQNLANLSEQYSRANIAREQQIGDMNVQRAQSTGDMNVQADRALQNMMRSEGQQAASLGFAAQGEAIGQMIGAPAGALDTGLQTYIKAGGTFSKEKGGMLEDQIYMTGGEFDHDTNKKALVDEETGEKEAELTGEEAVLNPEQTENTMMAFNMLKEAIEGMENPPKELLDALEKMKHFDEPQFQVPQEEIQVA